MSNLSSRKISITIAVVFVTMLMISSLMILAGMGDYKAFAKKQDGRGKGNSANQGIDQSQSSEQNSQCVAGGKLINSCNNLDGQDQSNSGNNAAAQDGGHGGHGKNSANQGIDQSQKSKQNTQCVSGEDATVSCNNAEFQKEVNSGNDVLGQKY